MGMKWQVRLSKRAVKNYQKLPQQIQERFKALALELRATGPVQRQWPHYESKAWRIAIIVI